MSIEFDLYYYAGGYKGMKSKYGKKITPYFLTPARALHYKQCYQHSSESLAKGTLETKTFKIPL